MTITRKLVDFVKLEDAKGNAVSLAGIGVAAAASLAVSGVLAPTAEAGHYDNPADYHSDYWQTQETYGCISWEECGSYDLEVHTDSWNHGDFCDPQGCDRPQ